MKKQVVVIFSIAIIMASSITGCSSDHLSSAGGSSASSKVESMKRLPHSLGLTGIDNARDLGGYKTTDGKTIKTGILLRSAKLQKASASDLSILTNQYHLTQVIDLRTSSEVSKEPDPQISGVTETNIPLLTDAEKTADKKDMKQEYIGMVTNADSITALKQFFTVVLNHKNGAILWHCSAGKDRTGVASVLLLSVLGVNQDMAIQDFMLSNQYYANSKKEAVKKEWAEVVFDTIKSKYGSMDNFLSTQLGLTSQNITQLRSMYLQ